MLRSNPGPRIGRCAFIHATNCKINHHVPASSLIAAQLRRSCWKSCAASAAWMCILAFIG
ncbi:hypothetical protein RHEC894_CH00257 [Rhizobium sp. CIAT894]|nr:hypothetical protein RHEC894_CH00257 [Rhizobium sp. CIAT894]